jgi:hypothetical protein
MDQRTSSVAAAHRERWLTLLSKNGVGHPTALRTAEVPGGLVQVTVGEPQGHLRPDGYDLQLATPIE